MTPSAFDNGLRSSTVQQASHAGAEVQTPAYKKLVKASQEFEGMLIEQLLGDFQGGFASLGSSSPRGGEGALNSLSIQSLSLALAHRGGLGIGQMLVNELAPSLRRGERGGAETLEPHHEAKVSPETDDRMVVG